MTPLTKSPTQSWQGIGDSATLPNIGRLAMFRHITAMLCDWVDARNAVAVGATLADHFVSPASYSAAAGKKGSTAKDWRQDVPSFRQQIAREALSLKLNLFKRAKMLNSFKWRLLELGFDPNSADELTQVVLMQLCVKGAGVGEPQSNSTAKEGGSRSTRRLPILMGEADALFAEGGYAEAAARLQEALTLEGRGADTHARLGAVLCCLGSFGEAQSALRRAIALKSSLASAHLSLGTLLRDKGEFAASETALRRAVKQDPVNSLALASLGLTLGMRGRLSEARQYFEKALRIKPRDAAALSSVGWLAGIEGRFEEAEKHCWTALEADRRHPGRTRSPGATRITHAEH